LEVKLTNLGAVIEACWNRAESETREVIARKHPAPQEDEITFLFCGELRTAVEEASNTGIVEKAFLRDLRQSIPALDLRITQLTSGLVAQVNRHSRSHEGRVSGADLGIVIVRPLVQFEYGGDHIVFVRDYTRGLLAQAKLWSKGNSSKGVLHHWDSLTPSQQRLYSKRREYSSFLLYRLTGQNASELCTFDWQLCRGHNLKQVKKWFRMDSFPEEISSSDLLRKLFAGSIGTTDTNIIKSVIDPPKSRARAVTLHIFWPDGKGPPPSLALHRQQQRVQQRLWQR
jgi:hypothetical protein